MCGMYMFRARGSRTGRTPIPGTNECHTIRLLFFAIRVLIRGVLGGVFLRMGYATVIPGYRPHRLENHIVE